VTLAAAAPAPLDRLAGDVAPHVATPALVVSLDGVRANVRRVIDALGGDAEGWRPHVKTSKLPEVWHELVRAGVRQFKCATVLELSCLLELLAAERVRGADVLLAHHPFGPALDDLAQLARHRARARIAVLAEDPADAARIPAPLGLFVDVDPGMRRTGIPADAVERIVAVGRAAGDRLRGVHFYEGHLHQADRAERARGATAAYDRLVAIVDAMRRAAVAPPEVVTSGTPTFLLAAAHAGLRGLAGVRHTVSPGTVVLHDVRSSEQNPDFALEFAAGVLARVVSRPQDAIATCDAGAKSIAAEAGDPCAIALGRPELVAMTPSEEHLPLRVTSGPGPRRGETLILVPRHVCPTVNLAEEAILLESGRPPRAVPVEARGH
jgi:D-serine deaminase-like pyridoxal phosphate-dependent protein